MAEVIRASGERSSIEPANGRDFTLAEMQQAVGGDVEVIYLHDGRLMLANESGHDLGLPWNAQAGELYPHSPIAGDVIVCDRRQVR